MSSVSVPLLVVHAWDDPLIPPSAVPRDALEANPRISSVFTERGGHIGWQMGPGVYGNSWSDKLVLEFFEGQAPRQLGAQETRDCANTIPASKL